MWLALRLVHWALDCRSEAASALVVQTVAQRQRVVAAGTQAIAAGVRCGMSAADAQMYCDDTPVYERNTTAETAALKRLAGWAWGYSDHIHWAVAGPENECSRLVLEIGASLRLFGGRRALLASIRDDLTTFAYRYRAGVGDSPQAALAFARASRRVSRQQGSHIPSSGLAELPIACLDLPSSIAASLAASGLRQTGELLALPPATLARRYGQSLLDYLEQLRARRPHGLALYRLPTRYTTRHELTGAVETTQGLVFVLHRAFFELAAFLRGAGRAIQRLQLTLIHEREPATRLVLNLSAPSYDAQHLERVTQERLAQLVLSAPVLEIGLASGPLRPHEHAQPGFWSDTDEAYDNNWPAVLDRLRARLGHNAVTWLAAPADHRPEHATTVLDQPPSPASTTTIPAPRPLWLLAAPQPIEESLIWISGPERIETGWWQASVRRDYYRALDQHGRLLWVFRDLQAARSGRQRYYLHGLFG